ncbi:Rz1-like lysis system protein LysC [Marinobacter shengliensis]|uniref:Rz1-like lysis system protein LysC n=1 Tax=Marinobacter shengliensis TaxID=1389223 RepID=UPI004044992B
MLFLTSCAKTQYVTRTVYVREPVPVDYLQLTPTPGPEVNVIGHCPDYVEVLKNTLTACNNDKLDVKDWDQVQGEKVQRMNAQ